MMRHRYRWSPIVPLLLLALIALPARGRAQVQVSGPDACRSRIEGVVGNVTIVCEGVSAKALAVLNRQLKSVTGGIGAQIERANRWASMYKDLRRHLSQAGVRDRLLKGAAKALESGDFEMTESLLTQSIKRLTLTARATARTEFELGRVLLLQFREHDAIAHLSVAYRLEPEATDFGEEYAEALVADGHELDGRHVYEKMLERAGAGGERFGPRRVATLELLLAELELSADEYDRAEAHFSSVRSRLAAIHDREADALRLTAESALTSIYLRSGRTELAETLIRRELSELEKSGTQFGWFRRAILLTQLGQIVVRTDRKAGLALVLDALKMLQALEESRPDVSSYILLAEVVAGEWYLNANDPAAAESILTDGVRRADLARSTDPDERVSVIRAWELYGDVATAQQRPADAIERYQRSIAHVEKIVVTSDTYAEQYGNVLLSLADAQVHAGEPGDAEETLLHALGVFELMRSKKMPEREHGRLRALIAIARLDAAGGALEQARKAYRDALEEIRTAFGRDSAYVPPHLLEMSDFELSIAKNPAEGCRLLSEALRETAIEAGDRQRALEMGASCQVR